MFGIVYNGSSQIVHYTTTEGGDSMPILISKSGNSLAIGQSLAKLRAERAMSKSDAAGEFGISVSTYERIENPNNNTIPSLEIAKMIIGALEIYLSNRHLTAQSRHLAETVEGQVISWVRQELDKPSAKVV